MIPGLFSYIYNIQIQNTVYQREYFSDIIIIDNRGICSNGGTVLFRIKIKFKWEWRRLGLHFSYWEWEFPWVQFRHYPMKQKGQCLADCEWSV